MFVIKHLNPAKNVKITSRYVSTIAEKFREDGFIQKYEVNCEDTFTPNAKCTLNICQLMPEAEMNALRKDKFDALENTRPNKKFIPQDINLHFTHRS